MDSKFNVALVVSNPPVIKIDITGGVSSNMMLEIYNIVTKIRNEQGISEKVILFIDVRQAALAEKPFTLIAASRELKKITQYAIALIKDDMFMKLAFAGTGFIAKAFTNYRSAVEFLQEHYGPFEESVISSLS